MEGKEIRVGGVNGPIIKGPVCLAGNVPKGSMKVGKGGQFEDFCSSPREC